MLSILLTGATGLVGSRLLPRLAEAGTDQLHMQRLKKRKLLLKDEISWLESRLIPDNIA